MELKTVYFDKPGKENTDETLRIAKDRANERGIRKVVVASTIGDTAVKAVDVFKGMNVIIVTHTWGLQGPNSQEFTEANRKIVEAKGATVVTAAHTLGGITRALNQAAITAAPNTYVIGDIVANTLRMFGQGMKVVCEITAMAADAGLVRTDEEVIAVAGTGLQGRGADVAVVIQPANSHTFSNMRIKEILCKPHF